MKHLRFLLPAATLIAIALTGCAQSKPVAAPIPDHINIHYRWGGLGPSQSENYEITKSVHGYNLQGNIIEEPFGFNEGGVPKLEVQSISQNVSTESVLKLRDAMLAPHASREELLAELTKPDWLKAHADEAYATVASTGGCSVAARDLFMTHFKSQPEAARALDSYFNSQWTDDYPSASVELTLHGGQKVLFGSREQAELMLPWTNGKSPNWNQNISLAVSKLLPKASSLKSRLDGEALLKEIADHVIRPIRDQWDDLELRCQHKDVVQAIERRFKILQLYGSFAGYARSSSMPSNLAINPVLEVSTPKQAEQEVELFFGVIDKYLALALPFVSKHPEVNFTLWYRGGHSLSDQATTGSDDPTLEQRIKPVESGSVLLREHDYFSGREWVITPTGEVFEWRKRAAWASRRPHPAW